MKRLLPCLVILSLLLTVSCELTPVTNPVWTASQLRLLDPAGDAPTPSTDILAVYTRTSAWEVQIRVDLLDVFPDDEWALQINFYDDRDYSALPLVVQIPAQGFPRASQPGNGGPLLQPRVETDPGLDTVTVSLSRFYLGDRYHFDVETLLPGTPSPADEARGAASDGPPVSPRAPLLLAFWNSFPAATPAQALRRWDGAHTGPYGGRHGLKHVLDAAERYRVPVALLDLKTPASLAALDALSGTGQVRRLLEGDLLILPDVAYGDPTDVSLSFSRRAAAGFGLPVSQFVYAPSPDLQPAASARFVSLPEASHLIRTADTRLIPLPAADAVQAADEGPSLDVRRSLVAVALSSDPTDLVVLGGDLPRSTWGNAQAAQATFAWLAAHPWIQTLDGEDLLAFPTIEGQLPTFPSAVPPVSSPVYDSFGDQLPSFTLPELLEQLKAAPENPISDLAWQTYFALTAPSGDQALQALRSQYYRNIASLIAASRWAEDYTPPVDGCDVSGYDGEPACILANEHLLAMIKLREGQLEFLFYRDKSGVHEIIGPSSQFTIGLSDPSEWKLERGPRADPSVIAGAFADGMEMLPVQTGGYTGDSMTLRTKDGSISKTFRLTEDGIEVAYHLPSPLTTCIPLVVDPYAFYFGPAEYQGSLAIGSWRWGLANGFQVEVQTDADLSAQAFTASLPFLSKPEDPDRDYPPGHYLPFPLSVVRLKSSGDFQVQIIVK